MNRSTSAALFSCGHQEDGKVFARTVANRFDDFSRCQVAPIDESGFVQVSPQCDSIKPKMKNTGVVVVELPFLQIEIGKTEDSTGNHCSMESTKKRFDFLDMVQGHGC